MTAAPDALPVYIRIGQRPPYELGNLRADPHGRIDPGELARFLHAVAAYIQSRVDGRYAARPPTPPCTGSRQ
jgi:hypothetical protein